MVHSLAVIITVFTSLLAVHCRPNDYNVDNRKTSAISNNLGDVLLDRLGQESDNIVYSPSSIAIALSALYVGSRGDTRNELGELGYRELEENGYSVPRSYRQLLQSLLTSSDEYDLEVANAVISQAGYRILKVYQSILRSFYGAFVKEVDFARNSEGAVREVNDWVSEKTHGKITELLDDLDESTRLLLLNAIYFKGTWKTEFDGKDTKNRPFYNSGEEVSTPVPTMKIKHTYPYLYDKEKNLRAIELPYKGEDISMVVLLPEERDGVWRLQNQIAYNDLYDIVDQLEETEVTVFLPKFKFGYSRSLANHLSSLGLKSMFGSDADLSGITGNTDLYVSDVVHKAVIEVNEEGSEAAGVTGVVIKNKMLILPDPDKVFNVDHPFLFYIIDKLTKSNLFVGRVCEL